MKKIHLFLLAAFFITLYSCGESDTVSTETETVAKNLPPHVGLWYVTKMDMSGEDVLPSSIGYPAYTFNEDKTYALNLSGQTEKGIWTLENDILHLKSTEVDKESELKILEVSENNMKYEVGDDLITIVWLERRNPEDSNLN